MIVHHPVLRVNADVPEPHVEILADSGWVLGPHPDTDPDYPMQVLPSSTTYGPHGLASFGDGAPELVEFPAGPVFMPDMPTDTPILAKSAKPTKSPKTPKE